MYVTVVPNRRSPPAILLRESYREDGKVKNRTLANISDWPAAKVEALQAVLKGDVAGVVPQPVVETSLAHGHVAAVLGAARSLGLERMLSGKRSRERDLAMALICGRVRSSILPKPVFPLPHLRFCQISGCRLLTTVHSGPGT